MLYIVVSFYHPGWFHNYIHNRGDDGTVHSFLFDIKEGDEGQSYLKLDHYDTRMYPFGIKEEKIMSYYTLSKFNPQMGTYDQLETDYGSDWIGF